MSGSLYPVPEEFKNRALVNREQYQAMYQESIQQPDAFWQTQAQRLTWIKPFEQVSASSFAKDDVRIEWFVGGKLNVAANCIDRHLPANASRTAIIWEGDDPANSKHISYQMLHDEVCLLANGLKNLGVGKGDRVVIYMPMIPQAVYAMLACARIGAIHSVIFGGFSPNAIADRIADCAAKVVITADFGLRGGNAIPLKANVDAALQRPNTDSIEKVVVFPYTNTPCQWFEARDVNWLELTANCQTHCEPAVMDAEDPLFILYTSGSTGKPKGVVHTSGGYLVYAALTHEKIFDYRPEDIYWCAADVGWITGHSYIVYGPLANCATTVVFEGIPTHPSVARMGQVIDKHQVSILYTAPTAIRALMAKGDEPVRGSSRESLRLLGSVGEPINPEAWLWYHQKIGNGQCPIVDTWWQTETGGVLISPLPGATALKPGSACLPFFGIKPAVLDAKGNVLHGECAGNLAIVSSWPGQARTVWQNHKRFQETYFSTYDNMYFTGDGAKRDADGYHWITGRVDDVLNVSGHRLGTAEIESALVSHEAVAEAAVVGCPHPIKGQAIYVYILPTDGVSISAELTQAVRQWVRTTLSPIATPDFIQWTTGLPKTRSGKIMRRILRKIAANDFQELGDTSTLSDPSVVESLIHARLNR